MTLAPTHTHTFAASSRGGCRENSMKRFVTTFAAIAAVCSTRQADVTVFTNQAQWQNAVGSYATIDFTDYPEFTTITDQYDDLGITFTDGNDFIFVSSSFSSDEHGLVSSDGFGNNGTVHMSFAQPQQWLAFEFIGLLEFELYMDGALIFASNKYFADSTPFVGLLSTDTFDAVVARDFFDSTIAIDNLHFGPPIPAPTALALFGLAGVLIQRRRRCDY